MYKIKKLFVIFFAIFLSSLIFVSCKKNNKNFSNEQIEQTAPQTLQKINLYEYALNLPGTYATENSEKPSSWCAYYFLGWSKDAKVAYIQESYSDGSGIYVAKLYIQDLISDAIISELILIKNELENSFTTLNDIVNQKLLEIQNLFSNFKIVVKKAELLQMPIKFENFSISAEVSTSENPQEPGLIDFSINALRSDGKRKHVTQTSEKDFSHEKVAYSADANFYIKSPYENRVAIFVHTVCRGFECQIDEYRMAGCLLTVGFK